MTSRCILIVLLSVFVAAMGCSSALSAGLLNGMTEFAENDFKESMEKLSKSNWICSKYYLGKMYYYGLGVRKDSDVGIKRMTESAELGCNESMVELADIYIENKKYAEGIQLLNQAVKNGSVKAASFLGSLFYSGNVVKKDYKNAVDLFSYAAINNDPVAQYMLYSCYFNGRGVKKSLRLARCWLKIAGDNNSPEASIHTSCFL